MAEGQPSVTEPTDDGPIEVPATHATLDALAKLAPKPNKTAAEPDPTSAKLVLLIKPNENARDIEALVHRRAAPPKRPPACLSARLKAHQTEGLRWLQDNWLSGSPGVLLADDMGLGKTLQGLAFLAWLREGMEAGVIARAPLLIVAPTGLLQNWRAEHNRHLHAPGLGTLVSAYGKGLTALRRGATELDRAALQEADWVLTTYETLRDYDRDFGQIGFGAMLLDEAQKVKTPGIRLTDAAKGMKADFRVAMTGTPVENRLSDLWCIIDGVAAGHLGDLKAFSATYEANPGQDKLAHLKTLLDRPYGGRPPLLLRRMRQDRLPDLPPCTDNILEAEMPAVQLEAYQ
jgi:SNF2 family DNA or RNA helicase